MTTLYEECVRLYDSGGVQAVLDHANAKGIADWRWCVACDAEVPVEDDTCLVCGESLPPPNTCFGHGHAEIRHSADECPLCETLKAIEGVLAASEDGGKMSDIDWSGLRAKLAKIRTPIRDVDTPSGGLLDCPSCGDPGHPKSDDGTWVQVACRNPDCDQCDLYRVSSKELNAVADAEG